MLKIKTPLKKLSVAVALGLFAGTASANFIHEDEISIYQTYRYIGTIDPQTNEFELDSEKMFFESATRSLNNGDWHAGYFKVDAATCPAGCTVSQVRIPIAFNLQQTPEFESADLSGLTVAIYSNKHLGTNNAKIDRFFPDQHLLTLNTPASVVNDGEFFNDIWSTADPGSSVLLHPNTEYWVKVSKNSSVLMDWIVNGLNKPGEWFASYNSFSDQNTDGYGSPRVFQVTGIPQPVPVPGAIWLMGTALIGLLASRRNKSV